MSHKGPSKIDLTKEELEAAYLGNELATMQSVAELYGVNNRTVERWLKHFGIPSKGKHRAYRKVLAQDLTNKEWLKEQMATKPQKQIAQELGVYDAVVSYWARKHGLADQKKSDAVKRGLKLRYPEGRTGENAAGWDGGRHITRAGYVTIYAPDHPQARGGRVFEHRLVMEAMLGRYLEPDEIVHHLNGVKSDNAESNLELKGRGEHIAEHFKASHEVTRLRQENEQLREHLKAAQAMERSYRQMWLSSMTEGGRANLDGMVIDPEPPRNFIDKYNDDFQAVVNQMEALRAELNRLRNDPAPT